MIHLTRKQWIILGAGVAGAGVIYWKRTQTPAAKAAAAKKTPKPTAPATAAQKALAKVTPVGTNLGQGYFTGPNGVPVTVSQLPPTARPQVSTAIKPPVARTTTGINANANNSGSSALKGILTTLGITAGTATIAGLISKAINGNKAPAAAPKPAAQASSGGGSPSGGGSSSGASTSAPGPYAAPYDPYSDPANYDAYGNYVGADAWDANGNYIGPGDAATAGIFDPNASTIYDNPPAPDVTASPLGPDDVGPTPDQLDFVGPVDEPTNSAIDDSDPSTLADTTTIDASTGDEFVDFQEDDTPIDPGLFVDDGGGGGDSSEQQSVDGEGSD